MAITREKFIEATGREPEQDDLERVNCKQAGEIGHFCCGWDEPANLPRFDTITEETFRAPFGGVGYAVRLNRIIWRKR